MGELVTVDLSASIATITMDSQHNRNALSEQLLAELHECIDVAEENDARAIVLRHEGPAFCAGADLKERSDGPPDATPFVSVLERLMDTERPTIAAVDGAVRAGGIGLMASCDLVVVNEATTFALTEVRIGVAAAIISVPILRRVPAGKIAAAMLTGEVFDAADARSMGLVTHVSDDVTATVTTLVDGVRAGAPRAVRETKAILNTVPGQSRDDAFAAMAALSNELFAGPDAQIGMQAFREKRRPTWT
ncbi:enoyl-CoA hydratase-related protein [Ilumatobacter nonamiensis]|uniref:enoyl-CoA hydratase-related protein n=1 Tax=Ilumatobacter nonamiensis TaxID=467093 RepID=UPI0003483F1E|nr:enoyl-CoA hydratase-related protein [Ilumatobacter nonamiensis]